MKHSLTAVVIAASIIGGLVCSRVVALDTVTWGGGNGRGKIRNGSRMESQPDPLRPRWATTPAAEAG